MSLQWSIAGGFLYIEIGFTILLLIPFVSTQLWYKCFRPLWERAMQLKRCRLYIHFGFYFLLTIMTVSCISAYNDKSRYAAKLENIGGNNPEGEMRLRLKLFRAQRNFYITGFAILLAGIIRRLLSLISSELNNVDGSANSLNENELARKVKTLQLEKQQLLAENKRLQKDLKEARTTKETK